MKKLKDKAAFLVSALFSPFVVIAVFTIVTVYYNSPSLSYFFLWSGLLVLFSILLPFCYIRIMVRSGKITDMHVSLREQRILPFAAALIGSSIVLAIYYLINVPTQLMAMILALLVNGVIFLAITKFWKVSMHASSFASSVMIAGMLVSQNIFWLLLFLAVIFWARIARGKHTFVQLLTGAVLSAAITALVLYAL